MVCRPAVIGLAEARVLIRSEKYLRWGDVSIVNINTETKHSQDHLTDNLIENFSVAETGPQVLDELQIGYNAGYTSSARVSRLTATVTSPAAFSPTGRGIFFLARDDGRFTAGSFQIFNILGPSSLRHLGFPSIVVPHSIVPRQHQSAGLRSFPLFIIMGNSGESETAARTLTLAALVSYKSRLLRSGRPGCPMDAACGGRLLSITAMIQSARRHKRGEPALAVKRAPY